jgi:hypothetical protein
MKRTAILSTYLCLATFTTLLFAGGKHIPQSLSVSGLGTEYDLIGRLDHPLGTMLTVKGTWGYRDQSNGPTKVNDLQLSITEVDGVPRKHPLILDVWSVHVIDKQRRSLIPPHEKHRDLNGVTWEFRAFDIHACHKNTTTFRDQLLCKNRLRS